MKNTPTRYKGSYIKREGDQRFLVKYSYQNIDGMIVDEKLISKTKV
tara:strand:+ start:5180 stop:5317 length:138 start_codon:yes stop_codon:yes gene_type:complete